MTILRMNNCKHCNRPATLRELVGGWSIWCKYSDAIACVDAHEDFCGEYKYSHQLYDDPTSAIVMWNMEHQISGIVHNWEFIKESTPDDVFLWKCPNCLEVGGSDSIYSRSSTMMVKNCRPDLKERELRKLKS